MLRHLMNAIRTALWPRWNARLPEATSAAKAVATDLGAEEAYLIGYRQAYWDAVVDMAETGLIRPQPEPVQPMWLPYQFSDEVHRACRFRQSSPQ